MCSKICLLELQNKALKHNILKPINYYVNWNELNRPQMLYFLLALLLSFFPPLFRDPHVKTPLSVPKHSQFKHTINCFHTKTHLAVKTFDNKSVIQHVEIIKPSHCFNNILHLKVWQGLEDACFSSLSASQNIKIHSDRNHMSPLCIKKKVPLSTKGTCF